MTYPEFIFFPRSTSPPEWVTQVVGAFRDAREQIDTSAGNHRESNEVLKILRPELEGAGFDVERDGKKIPRPVLYGEGGRPSTEFRIDAYNPSTHVVMEVEAGRGAMSNAVYRDIIRMALIVDAQYAVIAVPLRYQSGKRKTVAPAYRTGRDLVDSIYTSARLALPFKGLLFVGY